MTDSDSAALRKSLSDAERIVVALEKISIALPKRFLSIERRLNLLEKRVAKLAGKKPAKKKVPK